MSGLADYSLDVSSTAYCIRGTMADGSYTRLGSVASNAHPLGARITVTGGGGPGGRRRFTVRDRIGHSSELDFWSPTCDQAIDWGRRTVSYRLGWPVKRDRWRKLRRQIRRWGW